MNKTLTKGLKIIIPLAIGVGFMFWSYFKFSEEERHQIYIHIRYSDLKWAIISLATGLISHIVRALRWNLSQEPLGYQSKWYNNFFAVMIGYITNLAIPRSGEVLRATSLSVYEDIPFDKSFGTIITERVVDLLFLILVTALAFFVNADIIIFQVKQNGSLIMMGVVAIAVGILGLIIGVKILKKNSHPIALKLKSFLTGILDGVKSILKLKQPLLYILYSLIIWGCYLLMFWVIKYTLPETVGLTLGEVLVAFIVGTLAMMVSNGGLGIYPLAIASCLEIFNFSATVGEAFGWIMWLAQTLLVIILGAISFLLLPLINRK